MIWKLPVTVAHVGCVTAPAVGADGVAGWVFTTMFELAKEVQPSELSTVKAYVPAFAVTSPVPDTLTTDGEKVYVLVLS